jgi:predicted HTH transcriptional regulator
MHDKFFWIEEIKRILEEKRSEWQKLEFKSGSELLSGRPDGANGTISPNEVKFDIAKDVSSMANASGGTIIYGIAEDDSKADSISPVCKIRSMPSSNSGTCRPLIPVDVGH